MNDIRLFMICKSTSFDAMFVFLADLYSPRCKALWDREKRELKTCNLEAVNLKKQVTLMSPI